MATHALDSARREPRRSLPARMSAWWRDHRQRVMADAIERAIEAAGRPRQFSAVVPVRGEALEAREELLALAALLRTSPSPPPRAMKLCSGLILDGTSPLFNPEASGTLLGAVREARLAFDADPETYPPEV